MADAGPIVVSASEANRSFSALLRQATLAPVSDDAQSRAVFRRALQARLANQPASGEVGTWRRDELYD